MSIASYPSLKDRTVLISGGGSGIGAQIVRRFAEQGSRVGFLDIATEASEALSAELGDNVMFQQCDVTDIDALRSSITVIADHFGPVTVLVNNAAHDDRHTWEEVTED